MPSIQLSYGNTRIPFEYDARRFDVLGSKQHFAPLSDAEIGARLDAPLGAPPLEEIINEGERVLIVVPDATRQTASAAIVNLLVRRLIANGTRPFDIDIIFATGIHRKPTDDEKRALLSPFIFQRIKTLDHQAKDLRRLAGLGSNQFAEFGELDGAPVELNRALTEHDHVVIVGGITFHYFAGFTGGRKLICPGLASERTIAATHRLAFDCETHARRTGVGPGRLDGNAVHEAFMKVAANINPSFSVNSITNEQGEAVGIFAGGWIEAHRAGCAAYAAEHTVKIAEKRELVIVSCGGAPYDLNMIQAHKALETAARACLDGGTIVFLADCRDGLGRNDFLKWFEAADADALAEDLCRDYQVNGQTAWSLLGKAERFRIKILTSLPENETRRMRLDKIDDADRALKLTNQESNGYILPYGAKFLIES